MPRINPLPRKQFEQFLKYIGCTFKRQKGDHLIYDRPDLQRPVVFPYDKEIPPFVIRNNLRTLGINPKEYFDILERL